MGVVALFGFPDRWTDAMGAAIEELPRAAGEARLAPAGRQPGPHG